MHERIDRVWTRLLWRIGALLGLATLAGALLGQPLAALAVALALVLGYTLAKLHRLHAWLLSRRQQPRSEQYGLWYELHALLRRRQRDQRRRQRRLLALLATFREGAEALPDALIYLNEDLRILWFNPAATRLAGLSHPRDIGVGVTHLLRSPKVADWLAGGAAEPLFDVPAPDDASRRLSFRLIRYGHAGRQLLIIRDISQLMRLEQVRRDFVANVSHELRTPLTVLHGYLDLLDPEDAPALAPMLVEMRTQSLRMAQIVEDLLTLSRLEAGSAIEDDHVAMDGMLRTLRREAEALSQGRHRIVVDNALAADLIGSTKELHSAFSNLVSNAVRYTPADGRIGIAWRRHPDGGAALEVVDTGQGIAAQHIPRLTERFYRVSNSRSRDSGGTGLGLAIVKHVLALHQARLEISSEPGKGSRFACVFGTERIRSLPAAEGADGAGAAA
ncbi:MAG: phosphate regulon sensor histidine kinase PhoR [Xanthomonadales bacterium]|nr:phosphate regulon sensor histidine kinase PhoR [Xanthomonadales bacterium]